MRVNPQIGIASYLVNFGHEVTWILFSENCPTTKRDTYHGIDVYATPNVRYLSETSALGKGFNLIPAILRKLRITLQVIREGEYDLLFVREDTVDGLVGTYIKRKHKIPLVYERTDPLEQEAAGYRIESRKPLLLWLMMAKIKAWLKIYTMRRADLVLPTTRWSEEELAKQGIPESKLMPFPNGVDMDSLSNKKGRDIRKKLCLVNSKVIIYVGVMGKMRNLDVLIQAFALVKPVIGNIKLLMVGDGTGRGDLEKLAAETKVENDVIFTGQVPQSKVPGFIAAADIGVSIVPPLSFYKVSSPIKMLEYMAMAKPVVANEEILEHKEVLEQSRGGIIVSYTPDAFANTIIRSLDNPGAAAEMGRRGKEWVVKNRSYEVLARRLEEQYIQLLKHY
jgi:glycosyltransferase involved in cell wall biosynthesis